MALPKKTGPSHPGGGWAAVSETGRGTSEGSLAALQAANERRTIEAAGRNRKLAAAALMRLGVDCPPQLEEVGTEVILHSQCSWSEIGRRLGLPRHQVISRFRSLLLAAGMDDHAAGGGT
jgi:hypothetical protein